jgi:hypothetical protein
LNDYNIKREGGREEANLTRLGATEFASLLIQQKEIHEKCKVNTLELIQRTCNFRIILFSASMHILASPSITSSHKIWDFAISMALEA